MPILVGKWIYVHMPKTGGTWVEHYLINELGGIIYPHLPGHAPAAMVPEHLRHGKVLFGTVRDPWSWYASWYVHALNNPNHVAMLRVYGGGSTAFPAVLRGITYPVQVKCPANHAVIWGVPKLSGERSKFLARHESLYSWTFRHVYGNEVSDFVKMDGLTKNLGEYLHVTIDPERYPPRNVRGEREVAVDTNDLYTDELRELVAERDGAIAQRLGYLS